jgi:ubiquinone/menaquinone biosynthesis C-methylase UbiE
MEHQTAIDLIRQGVEGTIPQRWADLGAGDGVFTLALAALLPERSAIFAVDTSAASLSAIKPDCHVTIKKIVGDFTEDGVVPSALHGVMLANALHYVSKKKEFLAGVTKRLKQNGRIIIIEYDTDTSNKWVPFPISMDSLAVLADMAGFKSPVKIGSTPSRLNRTDIYAALIAF